MKICLVTTFFPPLHFGGDAVCVAHLANALARRDHEVHVVHCADSFELLRQGASPSPLPLDERIQVHVLKSRWGFLSPTFTHITGRPVLKRKQLIDVFSRGFDVVHWHNVSLVSGPGAFHLSSGIQLCTVHDYWLLCPTSILFKYNREICQKKDCIRCCVAHHRPPQLWRYGSTLQNGLSHIDHFITPSRYVHDKLLNSGLRDTATILPHFVPKVVPPDAEQPRNYYLYVGRLVRAKGLQTLLPLFARTGRQLRVVGGGGYSADLKRMTAGSPHVEFLGQLAHRDLHRLYAGAIATLQPSLCEETFGLTLLESLRARTPVITSHYGALPEIVADTGGGAVYRNPEELEALLRRFEQDVSYRQALGDKGFSNLERYSEDLYVRRYFDLIEQIARKRSAAPAASTSG